MQIVTVVRIYNGIILSVFHAGIDTDYGAFGIGIIINGLRHQCTMFNAIHFEAGNMQSQV